VAGPRNSVPGESVRSHRLLLLALVVLIPGIVLVALSVRVVVQERELETGRAIEARTSAVRLLSQQVLLKAERYRHEAASAQRRGVDAFCVDSILVATAEIIGEEPVFGWQQPSGARTFEKRISEPGFLRVIREGERAEFGRGGLSEAIRLYRRAASAASDSLQRAYSELLLARVLQKAERLQDAIKVRERLVRYPPTVIDEHGIPIALYAAERLADSGVDIHLIVEYLDRQASSRTLSGGAALAMIQTLLTELQSSAVPDSLWSGISRSASALEKEKGTKEDLSRLTEDYAGRIAPVLANMTPQKRSEAWIMYGAEPWLVGVLDADVPLLVVLDAAALLREIFPDLGVSASGLSGGRLTSIASDGSYALGSSFPNGYVSLEIPAGEVNPDPGTIRAMILLLVTLGAVSLGAGGAFVWYRGLQREVRTAKMRSSFVSSVSHELKTPLTSIRMFGELLRFRPPAGDAAIEYLDTIVNESQRLTRLLDNVLNFSKLEEGTLVYRLEPVIVNEILHSTLNAMAYPLKSEGFLLRTDISDDELIVRGDRDGLEQAVINLISNAMKYSAGSKEIAVRFFRKEDYACIEVQDHGIGIRADEIHSLFKSFYRSSDVHERHIPGTGLGLALVQHTLDAHDGFVTVTSEPGEGSTFSLHIPLITP